MKEVIFFTDKFGDLDHIRNIVFYLKKKEIIIHIFQNQLNHSISIKDYRYNNLSRYLKFFPENIFKLYNSLNRLELNKYIKIIFDKILKIIFQFKKKRLFLKTVKIGTSIIFCGSIDQDLIKLKNFYNLKTTYLLHGLKTHSGFKDKTFQKFLEKKKLQNNLDNYIVSNLNQWRTGGLKNKAIFLANPRYGLHNNVFFKKKIKIKYDTLLILDKYEWSHNKKIFSAFDTQKLIQILDFILKFNENKNRKTIIKFHPSTYAKYYDKIINFKEYNNYRLYINEKKTEELIIQSDKIIGFGSSSIMDAIFFKKNFLIPSHCLKYNSYFNFCCQERTSTSFFDFTSKFRNMNKIKGSNYKKNQYDLILGFNKNNLFEKYEKVII